MSLTCFFKCYTQKGVRKTGSRQNGYVYVVKDTFDHKIQIAGKNSGQRGGPKVQSIQDTEVRLRYKQCLAFSEAKKRFGTIMYKYGDSSRVLASGYCLRAELENGVE